MLKNEISSSREASIQSLIWMLSIFAIGITAWFSTGYFHADEHYQIIEFAGYQLGWNQEHELAWEFQRQIRPTLQPWIATGIIKSLHTFGLKDPYHVAFVVRFIMGIAMLFALRFFYRKAQNVLIDMQANSGFYRVCFFILLLFTWFVPFLSVRFSSETAAAGALLVAFGYLIDTNTWTKHLFAIGMWLGISFAFRFQIGFGIFGFGLWYLLFQRKNLGKIWQLILGFSVVILLTTLLDYLFYGRWTFTPWNYFAVNILEGESATFGENGIEYYIKQAFWLPTAFLGLVYMISFVYNLIFNIKSPLLWIVICFILGHFLIGHKEERFLFPIVFTLPYFVFFVILDIQKRFQLKTTMKFATAIFVGVNLVIYGIAFPAVSLEDCGLGRTAITKHIHLNYKTPITIIRPWYANPYNPWEGLPQNFYLDKNIKDVRVDNVGQFMDTLNNFHGTILVCVSEFNLLHEGYQTALYKRHFKLVKRSISQRKYDLDRYTKALEKKSVLYLYELKQ